MRKVWAKITCLHCGNEIVRPVSTYFNPNVDRDTDRLILEDELFYTRCGKCNQIVKTVYPSIYKDTKRKMIIFIKEKEIVYEPELRKRYVDDMESLKELIRCLRDNLEDQTVMQIKNILRKKYQDQEIHYLEADDEYLFFEVQGNIIGVPRNEYTKRYNEESLDKVLHYQ